MTLQQRFLGIWFTIRYSKTIVAEQVTPTCFKGNGMHLHLRVIWWVAAYFTIITDGLYKLKMSC